MPRAQLLKGRGVIGYHLSSVLATAFKSMPENGEVPQPINKCHLKNDHHPLEFVVSGVTPRGQFLTGRGKIGKSHSCSCLRRHHHFYVKVSFTLPFLITCWRQRRRTFAVRSGSEGLVSDALRQASPLAIRAAEEGETSARCM